MPEPPVTSDAAAFAAALRPGDVLLFEKLLRLSSLIAFTDLRPVSHAALVVEGGPGARIVDATLRGSPERTVEETALADLFGLRRADARGEVYAVRAVTARRARAAEADPAAGEAAAARARGYVHQARYGYFDVGSLGPYAWMRAGGREMAGPVEAVLGGLIQAARRLLVSGPAGGLVTCSELVYRALADGGPDLAPAIAAPLVVDGRLRTDWTDRSDEGERGFDLDAVFADDPLAALADDWACAKVPDDGPGERGLRRSPPPLEVADGVTPGDLLTSASMRTVAVFLRSL